MDVRRSIGRAKTAGLAAVATAFACAAFAPAAGAFGLSGLVAEPSDPGAGEHHDFHTHIDIDQPEDQIKDLTVHLPPGMLGDPTATGSLCTEAQLNADTCPADSEVGVTTSSVLVSGVVPQDINGTVYNVEPHTGEPARLGIVLRPDVGSKVVLQATAALRQSDFGLDTILKDLPNTANLGGPVAVPIDLTALDLTLYGDTTGKPAFMRNPTSCGEATTTFDATSYADTSASGSASFTPTGCDQLDFSPDFSATLGPGNTDAFQHPQLTTVIQQAETEAGLKQAKVFLPAETQSNNDALSHQCPIADFLDGECNENTQIGEAHASSPLLASELAGPAYLLATDTGTHLGVGLDLQGQLHLLLHGEFVFTPDLTQAGNLFQGLPDIPISNFALTIYGGDGGLLNATRDLCDPPAPEADWEFLGHNEAETTGSTNVDVNGCGPPVPPTARAHLGHRTSGQPHLRFKALKGSKDIAKAVLKLPHSLRFAQGRDFEDGAQISDATGPLPESQVTHHRRRLVITDPGTSQLKASIGHGALERRGSIGTGDDIRLGVKLTDTKGARTSLNLGLKR
jgi:hypothetical protein